MSARKAVLITCIIGCLFASLFLFSFTSEFLTGFFGLKKGVNDYIKDIFNLSDLWADTFSNVLASGVLSSIYYLLKILGLLRREESLKKEDLVEVIDKFMGEKTPELKSLEEFKTKLTGKYAVVCPYCEAWNTGSSGRCVNCGRPVAVRGIPPIKIPLPEVFDMLQGYYDEAWGKYSKRKLNDDLLRMGISPEEAVLKLRNTIRSRSGVAA